MMRTPDLWRDLLARRARNNRNARAAVLALPVILAALIHWNW